MLDRADFTRKALGIQDIMYRVACGMLKSEADRQDAIQQALMKAWEKRANLRNPAVFDSWLVRILINECKSIYRKQARLIPMASLPEIPVEATDFSVQDSVERLPEIYRVCVMLHYLEGMSTEDIRMLLKKQKERGATILMASHIAGDIKALCDTVHEMEAGQIRAI